MPKRYLTAPLPTTHMPPGVPYIIGNEAAERFSFYGMRTILVIFMTKYLLDDSGDLAPMSEPEATAVFHNFVSAVYFFPLFGALLSDAVLGKYRTIMSMSIVYCLGHLALAVDGTRVGLYTGLALIAIGSGGIKPCVSANVGDQFGHSNQHLLEKVFAWFYFSINLGSFVSTLLTPMLLEWYGPHVAFGVPGVLMLIATIIFWLGRNQYVHVPPSGGSFIREVFSRESMGAMGRLSIIYLFVLVFWALYDQTGSAWVLQAERMNRNLFGVNVLSSQIQAVNPILVLLFIPVFSYGIYPAIEKVFPLTALRKISIGLFLTAVAFTVSAGIEQQIAAGLRPSIGWQVLAYLILTAAEVMVSITCLEFSYTQAPTKLKSVVMAIFFLSISLGNFVTAEINELIKRGYLNLHGPAYYWFFTGLMFATAVLFVFVAMRYQPRTYIRDEAPSA